MRKPKHIAIVDEIRLLDLLTQKLIENNLHAENTIVVTVSTDYSGFVGQYLRHSLSHNREICDGFGIDVPYPDESWNDGYAEDLKKVVKHHSKVFANKNILLVEAAVIRGGNYMFVVDHFRKNYTNRLVTLAMYENIHSSYKSDFVGEYYNNDIDDITFWWERDNKHWS